MWSEAGWRAVPLFEMAGESRPLRPCGNCPSLRDNCASSSFKEKVTGQGRHNGMRIVGRGCTKIGMAQDTRTEPLL